MHAQKFTFNSDSRRKNTFKLAVVLLYYVYTQAWPLFAAISLLKGRRYGHRKTHRTADSLAQVLRC